MSFAQDYFNKYSPLYYTTSLNLPLSEEGPFNIFNENDLSEASYPNNSYNFYEGPTNFKTDFGKDPLKLDVYTFDKIKRIFQKYNTIDFEQILNNFIYDSYIEEAENKFMGKKRKRRYKATNIEGMKYCKTKGRKEKTDTSQRLHNKYSSDNIIKKIKSKLFEEILQFINNIVNTSDININIDKKKKILKDIDYKYINRLNKEYDLNLLNTSIKDLLSFRVSDKFHCFDKDFNKNLIKELMNTKNDNKFLMFALNMKFREWLDLFTLKIEFKEFSETFSEELNKNMTKVKDMIESVYSKNKDINYISSFIFYLYNYENWFIMKRPQKIEIKCPSSF